VNRVRPFSVKAVRKSSPTAEAKTTISSSFAITAGRLKCHLRANHPYNQPPNTKETNMTTPTKDRFATVEYNDPAAKLPKIQALRGEKGDIDCGYFITETEMQKAGWHSVKVKDLTIYQYNSGGQERGLLLKTPRMLVVQRSSLFAFDRQASMQQKQMIVSGTYSRQSHNEREKYGLGQYYEVLLLDESNEPLHELPLGYLAKGANQASFSSHWQQLVNEITRFHAQANGIPARPKNSMFTCLCVFQFSVKRELAGTSMKSYACKVDGFVSPIAANWESFFLGRESEKADRFLQLMAPTAPTMMALPQSQEPEAISGELVHVDH
jgi:hypothetical protein